MKIGNIISDSELVNHDEVDYINYHDFSSKEFIDFSLPTLFVGWITLKNTFSSNEFEILNKTIKEKKQYWEFSFDENKASHVSGIENFVDNLPKYYFESKYTYEVIDPVFSNIKTIGDIYDIFEKYDKYDSIFNYKDEFLYLLKDNNIFGIDLRMFDFFKFDKARIIGFVSIMTDKYIYDSDGEIKMNYYKTLPNFLNLRRYLVAL